MKIIRFKDPAGSIRYATREKDGNHLEIEGSIFGDFKVTGRSAEVVELLAPVKPWAIMAIALNYKAHAAESNSTLPEFPSLFMKVPSALQDPGKPIRLPRFLRSDQVDFEGELAIVLKKSCFNVKPEEALSYVLGYTCANDVSARDWQKKWGGGQFCRGKTFNTFCPMGPCLVTPDEITDPGNLHLRTWVNGELMQDASTANLIFNIPYLISFLSGSTRLEAGTVILTGTPHGVGMARNPPVFLRHGDQIAIEIEKIGRLENPVEDEVV